MRACLAALPRRHAPRHATCSRRARATSSCGCAATVAGDELTLDFTGSRRPARRQPQLPAVGHRARPAGSPCACSPTPTSRRPPAPTGRSTVIAPEGSLLNARPPAAVVAGNVETSLARRRPRARRVRPRARAGHDEQPHARHASAFTYYETLGGGQGACADADGPSGVHVAMSNTLNTPVEALELEFPLRVARYAIRRGSGGAGRAPRRRRRRARARGARDDGLLAAHRAPPPRAAGRRRRRARRARAQPARRRGAAAEGAR